MRLFVARFESRIGSITLVSNGRALAGLYFDGQKHFPANTSDWVEDTGTVSLATAIQALSDYFDGKLHSFTIPLEPAGTPFQLRVWKALEAIPYGATVAYSELSARLGSPFATRAVGSAVGRNPLSHIGRYSAGTGTFCNDRRELRVTSSLGFRLDRLRYLFACQARGIPTEGLTLRQHVTYDAVTKLPKHVWIELGLPPGFPQEYRSAVLHAASSCKVKKTIAAQPVVEVVATLAGNTPVEVHCKGAASLAGSPVS